MTALLVALIVMACLWAMTVWILLGVVRLRNRSSIRRSPTPSTTPTPTSDDLAYKMMQMMQKDHTDSLKEIHEIVVDLTQGRESQSQIGAPETLPMWNERPQIFDYDSTPLSPGIEAVLEREDQESEQARIAREREDLQRQVMEKQEALNRFDSETSSETGPWNGQNPSHATEPPT